MQVSFNGRAFSMLVMGLSLLGQTSVARAGVPECKGLRLENVGACEIKGSIQCEGGCSKLGIYKKACATKLQTVCRQDCTLLAEPVCTDECTVSCEQDCDRGVPVTCIHNCFGECVGSCDASCAGSAKPEQCIASCEATCDGQCDVQCAPVLDVPCYTHCIECCNGSCGAQANMDCQTTCQDEEFETCEHELEVECQGSCTGSGALFCDGEYVLSGSDIVPCANALATRGIGTVDLRVEAKASVDVDSAAGACSLTRPPHRDAGGLLLAAAGLLAGLYGRRRARRARI